MCVPVSLQAFNSGRTRNLAWRKEQLRALIRMLDENTEVLCDALKKDLGKPRMESMMLEIGFVRSDTALTLNNLDKWTKPQAAKKNLMTMLDSVEILPEPYGTVLIIGAWNYPVQLVFLPLLGAIGAGNCAIIKPSEVAIATSDLLAEIIPKYLDPECFPVVTGGIPETTALLEEKFDYIFFTGSSTVGKIIYQAAAKHLTPVTLELGGKSPCYIAADCNIDLVARRLIWGKCVNGGQTCVAPDYALVQDGIQDKLVESIQKASKEFFGEKPLDSDSLGCIVNARHYERVKALLSNGRVVVGGEHSDENRKIAPTVLVDIKPTDPCMQQEVFGPILPLLTVADEDEAISIINSREKPLSMYLFSKNQSVARKIMASTSSGGVTVNDTMLHAGVPALPFGGVGTSGMGAYHGKHSFDTFCHQRACLLKGQNMEKLNDLRYPPYSEKKQKAMDYILVEKEKTGYRFSKYIPFVLLGVALAMLIKTQV